MEDLDKKDLQNRNSSLQFPPEIMAYIHKKIKDDKDNDIIEYNREQWEHVARVMDMVFMLISFFVIIGMLGGFLGFIISGKNFGDEI